MRLGTYHEMINSVSVIKAVAEILIEDEPDPEKKDMLSKIVSRSKTLIEQITDFRNQ